MGLKEYVRNYQRTSQARLCSEALINVNKKERKEKILILIFCERSKREKECFFYGPRFGFCHGPFILNLLELLTLEFSLTKEKSWKTELLTLQVLWVLFDDFETT